MAVQGSQWVGKAPWYNTTICKKRNLQSFEAYFKTVRNDRHEFMCSANVYDKEHVTMPDDASSGGGLPMTSTSSKEALFSLVLNIKFIDN